MVVTIYRKILRIEAHKRGPPFLFLTPIEKNKKFEKRRTIMKSHYKRLSLGERNSIENYLNQNKSARYISEVLERSVSTISYEVRQNRLLSRGKYKGIPAKEKLTNYSTEKICPKLQK